MQQLTEQGARRRVALYSHDTQGLGHIRRNISIASALVESRPDTDILLLTGAPEATSLPLPANTEVVTLPTLHKDIRGEYSPRVLGGSLEELIHLRGQIIAAAVTAFQPDIFVVDKVARGVRGELDPILRVLRGGGTKVVLGLRDVLDSPGVTVQEWQADRTVETVRDLYDEVWVYGDPAVFDAVAAYAMPWPMRSKVVYTGYLADRRPGFAPRTSDSPAADTEAQDAPPAEPYVLCLVGGGQDGSAVADVFVDATFPEGHRGVLITGPYMTPQQRRRLARAARDRSDLIVLGFTSRAHEFIAGATATVTMGGYNSVCELLAARCPALVVPRVVPRMEQALRADALSRLGWVDSIWPHELAPGRIGDWLERAVASAENTSNGRHRDRRPIDLDGLAHIPLLAEALLNDHLLEVHDHAAV